jgi:hypothetical protein
MMARRANILRRPPAEELQPLIFSAARFPKAPVWDWRAQ